MPAALLMLLVLAAKAPSASVQGKAMFESSPLPGADVSIISPAGAAKTVTDANGQFAFPEIAPGRYDIEYSLNGLTTERHAITIRPGNNELPPQSLEADVRETRMFDCSSPCTSAA